MNITLNYKGKSFVVSGSNKEFKDQLMVLGGKYNPHLSTGPGFIFFNKRENEEQEVTDFVFQQNQLLGHKDGLINKDLLLINNNKKDILSLDNKLPLVKKNTTVKSPLLSTNSLLNYPNRFIGSDGLQYQIIIQTFPLPYLNQKVTVKYNDNSFDGIVSNINDDSVINDIILTYQENDVTKQTRAVILNCKWQIYLLDVNHELIFH